MRIEEIRIYGLRGIIAFEHRLSDEWLGEVPRTLLVSGLNGSGKTTLLDAIATLWNDLGAWLEGKSHAGAAKDWLFADTRLVAMRFADVFGGDKRPVWLFAARPNEFESFRREMTECHFIGVVNFEKDRWRIETDDEAFLKAFARLRTENLADGRRDLPGVVYVTSDERRLFRPTRPVKITPDPPEYNWLARYTGEPPLVQMLYRMDAQSPAEFVALINRVNGFLEEKWIVRFDEQKSLEVMTKFGGKHDVHVLSTGERQALILIAFAHRWLRQGGILLVDEPDLYLHPSWIEQITATLARLVEERGGQFIFTSHSPLLWENYSRDATRIPMGIKTSSGRGASMSEGRGEFDV